MPSASPCPIHKPISLVFLDGEPKLKCPCKALVIQLARLTTQLINGWAADIIPFHKPTTIFHPALYIQLPRFAILLSIWAGRLPNHRTTEASPLPTDVTMLEIAPTMALSALTNGAIMSASIEFQAPLIQDQRSSMTDFTN